MAAITLASEAEIAYMPTTSIKITSGHIYYWRIDAYVDNFTSGSTQCFYVAGLGTASFDSSIKNQWQVASWYDTASATTTVSDIRMGKPFNTSAVWSAYFDSAMIIDLTANFGSGKEPTKEWCDRHITTYFDNSTTIYK